jgi:hypothetical protein
MRIINTVTGQPDEVGIDAGQYLSANISEVCVPKKLGGDIVSHHVHKQLSDFGVTPVVSSTISWTHPNNTPAIRAANTAAFNAAGASGEVVEIPPGIYYVNEGITITVSGSKFRGLGGGFTLFKGADVAVATEFVRIGGPGGVEEVGIENGVLDAASNVTDILVCQSTSALWLQDVTLQYPGQHGWGFRFEGSGSGQNLTNVTVIQGERGFEFAGTGGGVCYFIRMRNCGAEGAHCAGLHLTRVLNVKIDHQIHDQQPHSQINYYGPFDEFTNEDDTYGIKLDSTCGEVTMTKMHIENIDGTRQDVGTGIIYGGSSADISGDFPGWRRPTDGFRGRFQTTQGYTYNNQRQTEPGQMCVCTPAYSPTTTATWSDANICASTTTTTECKFRFSLPVAPLSCVDVVNAALARADTSYTAAADIIRRSLVDGSETVLATYTLTHGDNSIAQDDSGVWPGYLYTTDTDALNGAVNCAFFVDVRVTPGAAGAVKIYPPRINFTRSLPLGGYYYPTDTLEKFNATLDVPAKTGSPANVGVNRGNVVLSGAATLVGGVLSCPASGDRATYTYAPAPSGDFTVACSFQYTVSADAGMIVLARSDETAEPGTGIIFGRGPANAFAGAVPKVAWITTGVAGDNARHTVVISYAAAAHTTKIYLDGVLRATDSTHTLTLGAESSFGCIVNDGTAPAGVSIRRPFEFPAVANAGQVARLHAVLSTI